MPKSNNLRTDLRAVGLIDLIIGLVYLIFGACLILFPIYKYFHPESPEDEPGCFMFLLFGAPFGIRFLFKGIKKIKEQFEKKQ